MKLPQEFLHKMNRLLGDDEFEKFIKSYQDSRTYGLRINTLKISVEEFLSISPFELKPIPWVEDGFYYDEDENPGKHPYYHAGLYYIQEPSAMLPGKVLDAKPGENVLDLCAAPGGKTVQIAASMKGKGLLVANDINKDRTKALVKNIELYGVKNAVVTNDSPEVLSSKFSEYFDKILVDAPCSGEGMFRKDEEAVRSWEKFKCDTCASMQENILENAHKMLKPGGMLVYSTCTFSPEEDEIIISQFIEKHNDYELVEITKTDAIEGGRPQWADGNPHLTRTARLWPHKVKGEGHFVAALRKKGIITRQSIGNKTAFDGELTLQSTHENVKLSKDVNLREFDSFVTENLNYDLDGFINIKGSNLYWLPVPLPDLRGVKVAKFGWYLGAFHRERFRPAHSMVIALNKSEVKTTVDFASDSKEALSYLKGETLIFDASKGLTAVCIDGYTVGWGKHDGSIMKNLYPSGWRKMS